MIDINRTIVEFKDGEVIYDKADTIDINRTIVEFKEKN